MTLMLKFKNSLNRRFEPGGRFDQIMMAMAIAGVLGGIGLSVKFVEMLLEEDVEVESYLERSLSDTPIKREATANRESELKEGTQLVGKSKEERFRDQSLCNEDSYRTLKESFNVSQYFLHNEKLPLNEKKSLERFWVNSNVIEGRIESLLGYSTSKRNMCLELSKLPALTDLNYEEALNSLKTHSNFGHCQFHEIREHADEDGSQNMTSLSLDFEQNVIEEELESVTHLIKIKNNTSETIAGLGAYIVFSQNTEKDERLILKGIFENKFLNNSFIRVENRSKKAVKKIKINATPFTRECTDSVCCKFNSELKPYQQNRESVQKIEIDSLLPNTFEDISASLFFNKSHGERYVSAREHNFSEDVTNIWELPDYDYWLRPARVWEYDWTLSYEQNKVETLEVNPYPLSNVYADFRGGGGYRWNSWLPFDLSNSGAGKKLWISGNYKVDPGETEVLLLVLYSDEPMDFTYRIEFLDRGGKIFRTGAKRIATGHKNYPQSLYNEISE